MILFDGIYAPNIKAIIQRDNHNLLSRYKKNVVEKLGHDIAFQMCAVELILVPETKVEITISSYNSWVPAKCLILFGSHSGECEQIITERTTITIEPPKLFGKSLTTLSNDNPKHVVRILLYGDQFEIHEVKGKFRLPLELELPSKKIMTYGTSITQGIGATAVEKTYAFQLAKMTNSILYNYALSGKCFIEKYVVDAITKSKEKYDIIIYECSVNMIGAGYSVETYEERLRYLLEQTQKFQPQSKVFLISILPYFGDYGYINPSDLCNGTADEYRKIAKKIAAEFKGIVCIEPFELLEEKNLSIDLIHPSNQGMEQIAMNLVEYINSPIS